MPTPRRSCTVCVASLLVWVCAMSHAAEPVTATSHFLGQPSCASSSCHGGGVGKDQCIIWQKKDVHTRASAILSTTRSQRIAETLGITDPARNVRCTECHSPMESVSPALLASNVKADKGVSCETCHGPAERYLTFHTRTDVTHEQRVAMGMREVKSFYGRANTCVACHLNIRGDLVAAGHPELFFELDGQMRSQPPHWTDEGSWLGPRAWLTGQAAVLRELSWKIASAPTEQGLVARRDALIWLLQQTPEGAKQLAFSTTSKLDPAAVQAAADRLARIAGRAEWTREMTTVTLRKLAATSSTFRDELQPNDVQRRRAKVLVMALDCLWGALKANGTTNDLLDRSIQIVAGEERAQQGFSSQRFAAALQQVEVAVERWSR